MATLIQYMAFHTLVQTGSFSETGLKLNLTQSSISHSISKLESEFELSLIIRKHNTIKLTNEGKIVYKHILQILQEQKKLEMNLADLKNLIGGTLSIGIIPSVSLTFLPKVLAHFEKNYPNLRLQLVEGNYDQIEEWLQEGLIDLGFLVEPSSTNFMFEPIFDDELICIMSEKNLLASESKIRIEQLKNERWIMPKRTIDRDVSRILAENKIHPNIIYEFSVDQVILTMVNENLGISVIPKSLLIHAPKSIIQKNFFDPYVRHVGIAYKRSIHLSPGALKFVKISKYFSSFFKFDY